MPSLAGPLLSLLSHLSDIPLLKTLPADFLRDWESADRTRVGKLKVVFRSMCSELYSRFDTYAPRIKHFGTETHYFACTMFDDAFFLLSVKNHSRSFASKTDPHAIHLSCTSRLSSTPDLASLLVGPSLQALRLDGFFDGPAFETFFARVARSCPSLSQISVFSPHETISPIFPSAILDIIRGSMNMRKFCFTAAPANEAVLHMASIPTLTEAQFRVNSIDAFHRLHRIPLRQWFPVLQSLTIYIPQVHFATALLQAMQPCQLRELRVICDRTPSALGLQEFLSVLRDSCSHSSLVLFQLGVPLSLATDLHLLVFGALSVSIDIDTIAPLLEFTKLQSVWFDTRTTVLMQMDNATLLRLAMQLPRLEVLRFSTKSPVTLSESARFACASNLRPVAWIPIKSF
ncbi:hypothetical protein A0H81_10125 [Grifola frondosa]|uniref:F-box domain-containing protein n=1 Tax=Grifola frondosa TaxID=5627 RepID=A0A1C7LXQ0_GRIFR|nr:hypothetical protein A0H81_10125 [Grifola frondosa]